MKLIEQYGNVWQVSEEEFEKLKKDIRAGKGYDLNKIGTYLGAIAMHPDREQEKYEDNQDV